MTATLCRRSRLLDATSGSVHLPGEGERPGAVVVFRLIGPEDAPVVAVLGGISAHRTVADLEGDGTRGWWADQVGPGRSIDTRALRVLSIDWLGAPDASSWIGRAGASRPTASPETQAHALLAVLDRLGIERLTAFVGASFGGMVGLSFAALAPTRLERLIVLSAAHESSSATSALRSIQRRVVRLGVAGGDADAGLRTARALAMIGYRSPVELERRFPGPAGAREEDVRHPVDDWLDHVSGKVQERFDVESYLTLSEGLDLHQVRPERVTAPLFAWGVHSDSIVPIRQMEELVARVGGPARLEREPSIYGHDAFLKETAAVSPFLENALDDTLPPWTEVRG